MTLEEIAKSGYKQVHVLSYGYMSQGIFSHFEPFKSKREFIFDIVIFDGEPILEHKWLFFLNGENNEFYYIKDGKAYCDDPELKEMLSHD